jgi:WD repeat-containing protein 23
MIYSSITPYVHMLRTAEDDEEHVCLDFNDPSPRRGDTYGYDNFGVSPVTASRSRSVTADIAQIWSIRFSSDGKEVVAGAGNGQIMVYDIEAERRSLAVAGHADDGMSPRLSEMLMGSQCCMFRRRIVYQYSRFWSRRWICQGLG